MAAALTVSLSTSVVLNLSWIGPYGLSGACWAVLAAEWIQSGIFGLQIMTRWFFAGDPLA